MKLIGDIKHSLPLPHDAFCLAVVHHRRRKQAQAGVAMLLVVPTKKSLTKRAAVLDAPKAIRELRPILQSAELTFGERIVVANVRPTMGFPDAQIGQDGGDA